MKNFDKPPSGIEFVKIKEVSNDGWVCPKCGKINAHIKSWCSCVYVPNKQMKQT